MEHMKALSSTCDGGDGTGGGRGKGGNKKLMEQHVYWLWIPKYTLNRIFISLRIEKFIVFYSSSFIFHGPGVLRCTDCGSKKEKKEGHKKERDSKDWSLSPLFYTTEFVASIPMFSSPVWDPGAGAGPYPLRGSLGLLSKSLWLFLTLQTSISSGFHLLPSFQGCTPSALGTEPLLLPPKNRGQNPHVHHLKPQRPLQREPNADLPRIPMCTRGRPKLYSCIAKASHILRSVL